MVFDHQVFNVSGTDTVSPDTVPCSEKGPDGHSRTTSFTLFRATLAVNVSMTLVFGDSNIYAPNGTRLCGNHTAYLQQTKLDVWNATHNMSSSVPVRQSTPISWEHAIGSSYDCGTVLFVFQAPNSTISFSVSGVRVQPFANSCKFDNGDYYGSCCLLASRSKFVLRLVHHGGPCKQYVAVCCLLT